MRNQADRLGGEASRLEGLRRGRQQRPPEAAAERVRRRLRRARPAPGRPVPSARALTRTGFKSAPRWTFDRVGASAVMAAVPPPMGGHHTPEPHGRNHAQSPRTTAGGVLAAAVAAALMLAAVAGASQRGTKAAASPAARPRSATTRRRRRTRGQDHGLELLAEGHRKHGDIIPAPASGCPTDDGGGGGGGGGPSPTWSTRP